MKTNKHAPGWALTAPGREYFTLFRPGGALSQIDHVEKIIIRKCREGVRIFIPNEIEAQLNKAEPTHVSDLALIRSMVEAQNFGLPVTPGVSANPPN